MLRRRLERAGAVQAISWTCVAPNSREFTGPDLAGTKNIRCIAIEDQHCNRTIQIYFAASCAEIPKYAAALILITVPHPASGEQSFRLPP